MRTVRGLTRDIETPNPEGYFGLTKTELSLVPAIIYMSTDVAIKALREKRDFQKVDYEITGPIDRFVDRADLTVDNDYIGEVAIKRKSDTTNYEQIKFECELSMTLEHKNILKYFRVLHDKQDFKKSKRVFLVMEVANLGAIMSEIKIESRSARQLSNVRYVNKGKVNKVSQNSAKFQKSKNKKRRPKSTGSKIFTGIKRRPFGSKQKKLNSKQVDNSSVEFITSVFEEEKKFKTYEGKACFTTKQAKNFLIPITDALIYLHNEGIVHFDIKPENIVLCVDETNQNIIPKLMDFGISEKLKEREIQTCLIEPTLSGTPGFRSPERRIGHFNPFADEVWSIGATYYTMTTGKVMVNESEIEDNKEYLEGALKRVYSNSKIITCLCDIKPSKRPTMKEVKGLFQQSDLS